MSHLLCICFSRQYQKCTRNWVETRILAILLQPKLTNSEKSSQEIWSTWTEQGKKSRGSSPVKASIWICFCVSSKWLDSIFPESSEDVLSDLNASWQVRILQMSQAFRSVYWWLTLWIQNGKVLVKFSILLAAVFHARCTKSILTMGSQSDKELGSRKTESKLAWDQLYEHFAQRLIFHSLRLT